MSVAIIIAISLIVGSLFGCTVMSCISVRRISEYESTIESMKRLLEQDGVSISKASTFGKPIEEAQKCEE